jgi:hypothetical protein
MLPGLLLAIGIVAIAREEFVIESDEFLSDSYDLSFSIAMKLRRLGSLNKEHRVIKIRATTNGAISWIIVISGLDWIGIVFL